MTRLMPRVQLLALAAAGALALLEIVLANSGAPGPVRVALGVPFVLAAPGFALVCAVLPGGLSAGELLIASLGASLAVTVCSAVLLGATVGMSGPSVASLLGCVTIAASASAWVRVSRLERVRGEIPR